MYYLKVLMDTKVRRKINVTCSTRDPSKIQLLDRIINEINHFNLDYFVNVKFDKVETHSTLILFFNYVKPRIDILSHASDFHSTNRLPAGRIDEIVLTGGEGVFRSCAGEGEADR